MSHSWSGHHAATEAASATSPGEGGPSAARASQHEVAVAAMRRGPGREKKTRSASR